MKYLVTFQDRITKVVVQADSPGEASVKAQAKHKKGLLVIRVEPIPE
jgi:hypothetical protein